MRHIHFIGTSLLAMAAAHPVFAQTTPAPAEEAAVAEIDEIIVTASGRAQIAQDVPIAVSVVGGQSLVNAGINDIRGIRQLTPSLQATTGQSAATGTVLRIRGIGTAGDNPGFEPAVGVFIDGVFRARAGVALGDLPPLDRVEVLRGPQGTLFGRNTSAGALSIFTEGPKFDLGGYVSGSYGNYDAIEIKAGVTGPLSEKVAVRLDGGYRKRDGYVQDVNANRRFNNVDRFYVRGQALFEDESLKVRVIGDYAQTDEQCCGLVNSNSGFELLPSGVALPSEIQNAAIAFIASNAIEGLAGSIGLDGIVRPYDRKGRRVAYSPNRNLGEAVREYGLSGQVDWTLGDVKLTSITAYRNWEVTRGQDIDFSGIDRAYREGYKNEISDFSQEFRLAGSAFDGRLDWLVGGFYLNEKLSLTDTVRFGTQANQFTDQIIRGLTASSALPSGLQVYGTLGPTVPLFGQVALATNPTLLAAALGNPALFALFNSPIPQNPAGSGQVADNYRVSTEAFAIFTHNIINITDNLSLTLGARYNKENKKIDANLNSNSPSCAFYQNPANAPYVAALQGSPIGPAIILYTCNPIVNTEFNGIYNDKRSENELTGTAKLAFKINRDVLIYGGYDHGYKAGGYNLDRATFRTRVLGGPGARIGDLAFNKETVDAYEIGVKTSFSRAFTLNIAAFQEDFKDFQDLTFIGTSFAVTSVKKVRSRGVELEANIRPERHLNVNFGYSYTEAQYLDATLPPSLAENNGVQLTNTPENVVTAALTWTPELSDSVGGLFHVDMRYNSDSTPVNSRLAQPYVANDGYVIASARIGLNVMDNKLALEAFVENLFDSYYSTTATLVPEQGASFAVYPGTPRFYGVKASFKF
jgi:iron complex outermembrane recepter protein